MWDPFPVCAERLHGLLTKWGKHFFLMSLERPGLGGDVARGGGGGGLVFLGGTSQMGGPRTGLLPVAAGE